MLTDGAPSSTGRTPTAISIWRRAASFAWLAFFTLATLTLLAAIPARWTELTQPSPLIAAHLAALGWVTTPYAVWTLGSEVVFAAGFLLVAVFIFLRRPDDRMAWFTALVLVVFGVGNQSITLTLNALRPHPVGQALFAGFGFAAWGSFTQFAYLFPSGRYVPRWTRLPGLLWVLLCIPWNLMPGSRLDPTTWPAWLFMPLLLVLWLTFAVAQVYRFVWVSSAIERQQTKWVLFALLMVIVGELLLLFTLNAYDGRVIGYLMSNTQAPPTPGLFAAITVARSLYIPIYLMLPLGMAVAILRYRLFDIDLIIRRTLVYSAVSAVLALAYFGSVLLLQSVFQAITGEGNNALVTVLSTLFIAALFGPVRSRVQRAIDRRFYRQKYDAARTLAAFGARARDVVALEQLSEELLAAVDATMQPAHLGLWVRHTSGPGRPGTP
ncbi:MAG: hypothetical protein IT317_05310 [Anaerolineales bacterium]|nr:hypothetical protein [Anaerolineales bacterium]